LHRSAHVSADSSTATVSTDSILLTNALTQYKERIAMKNWKAILMGALLIAPTAFARGDANAKDETKRLENAGTVMDEILNVPDDIPQDLLDKARCVVVLPSVLKAAFIVGGSYGRGTMVGRTGEHFRGPWGAPAMYALEGGSIGLQIGGQASGFV